VIFSPASIGMSSGGEKCNVKSISPRASNLDWARPASDIT
jgi:hypothetical protein